MHGGGRGNGRGVSGARGTRRGGSGGRGTGGEVRRLRAQLDATKARIAELETDERCYRSATFYACDAIGVVGFEGGAVFNRLLHIPDRVRQLLRRGVCRAGVIGVTMAGAATQTDTTGIGGFPNDNPIGKNDLAEYADSADAIEALVPLEAILDNDV